MPAGRPTPAGHIGQIQAPALETRAAGWAAPWPLTEEVQLSGGIFGKTAVTRARGGSIGLTGLALMGWNRITACNFLPRRGPISWHPLGKPRFTSHRW